MSCLPCIILGDFNEDIMQNNDNGIVSFMSSCGYTQLVTHQQLLEAHLLIMYITIDCLTIYKYKYKTHITVTMTQFTAHLQLHSLIKMPTLKTNVTTCETV